MVARRRFQRLLRRGDEGRCLRELSGLALLVLWARSLVDVWEVAEWRDVTEVECACCGRRRVLLFALTLEMETECRWDGGWRVSWECGGGGGIIGTRFVVELAAEGRLDTLEMLVVLAFGWLLFPPPPPSPESCRRGGPNSRLSLRSLMLLLLAKPSSGSSSVSSPIHQSQSSQPITVEKLPQPTTVLGLTRSKKMPAKQTTKQMTEQTCCTMTVESATRGQKS
jgi:hypothetical protein